MGRKRIAICPKCEKIYPLKPNQYDAYCQHLIIQKRFVDGKEEIIETVTLPETEAQVEKIKCKIVEVKDKE
jgi:hypothetical protein